MCAAIHNVVLGAVVPRPPPSPHTKPPRPRSIAHAPKEEHFELLRPSLSLSLPRTSTLTKTIVTMQLSARPATRGPVLAQKQRTAAPLRLANATRGASLVPRVAAIEMPAVEERQFARKPVRSSAHRKTDRASRTRARFERMRRAGLACAPLSLSLAPAFARPPRPSGPAALPPLTDPRRRGSGSSRRNWPRTPQGESPPGRGRGRARGGWLLPRAPRAVLWFRRARTASVRRRPPPPLGGLPLFFWGGKAP